MSTVGQRRAIGGQRHRLALERPGGLDVAEQQHDRRIDLGGDQQEAPGGVERPLPVGGLRETPEHVAARRDHRQHDHHERRVLALQAAKAEREEETEGRERKLLAERERHRDHEIERDRGEQRDQHGERRAAPDARIDDALQPRRRFGARCAARGVGRAHATFLGEACIEPAADRSHSPHARRSAAAWLSGS